MTVSVDIATLPNIGVKLATLLRKIDVYTKADLQKAGAARLYKKLQSYSEKRLPVCYYLYSLEGAIRGIHWNDLSDRDKKTLRLQAGLAK